MLKNYWQRLRENKAEKLLKDKEKEKQVISEQQQKYVATVEESVNTLNSVRGIPISGQEKSSYLITFLNRLLMVALDIKKITCLV